MSDPEIGAQVLAEGGGDVFAATVMKKDNDIINEYHQERIQELETDDNSDYADSIFSLTSSSSSLLSHISAASSTSSLYPAVAGFRFENNRRYNSYRMGKWILPNDEQEQDRMQIIDQMLILVLNGERHTVPILQPQRILDVGTGTGVWAIEMAYKFPNARIIGTDLSPIQVGGPPNCSFEIEDADDQWIFPPGYFSLIHSRILMGGIENWPRLFEQAYNALQSGGWLELQEIPYSVHSDDPKTNINSLSLAQILTSFTTLSAHNGRVCGDKIHEFKQHMAAAGFVDITETRYRLPIGNWDPAMSDTDREVGMYNVINHLEGIEGFSLAICNAEDSTVDAAQAMEMAELAKRDILNRKLRLFNYLVILKGRKP